MVGVREGVKGDVHSHTILVLSQQVLSQRSIRSNNAADGRVEKGQSKMSSNQLALFNSNVLLDARPQSFNAKPVTRKLADGTTEVVGTAMVMKSRKEIADEKNLKGKDNKEALDEAIRRDRNLAFQKARLLILQANPDEWEASRMRMFSDKKGRENFSISIVRSHKEQITLDKMMRSYGISKEEAETLLAKQLADVAEIKRKSGATDVDASVSQNGDEQKQLPAGEKQAAANATKK